MTNSGSARHGGRMVRRTICAPGCLAEAWNDFVPCVRDLRSQKPEFLNTCRKCELVNLCLWCPAHAHLETGALDGDTPHFCAVAHARAAAITGQGRAL